MDSQSSEHHQLALIGAGQTDWDAKGRMVGGADLPLNEHGHRQISELAKQLAGPGLGLAWLGVSPRQTVQETAAVLADALNVPVKTVKGLEEVDIGLWEGLTTEQIRQRYPKVYKQWTERPTSVCPPEGESVAVAADRLMAAIERLAAKSKGRAVGVVLGRLAIAVVRCRLAGEGLDNLWSKVDTEPCWYCVDVPSTPR